MKVRIDEIIIENRIRKDMGDIEALAASIKKCGLFNPPIISADNRLITGERRIRAAQMLGWEEIAVMKAKKKIMMIMMSISSLKWKLLKISTARLFQRASVFTAE